ncbi:hypothetical protein BGZ70_007115 [Mortierella alpina]|uniref:Uncharacterized protein n=1 Tax=Mortierella alpina TaxID=64518 RepID=A0A9P6M3D3_MORAP|nr:hypothetical protein BGZ70_007115 [Mortierella alpina]
MFTPRKNRPLRKRVDVDDEESSAAETPLGTPAGDSTDTPAPTFKAKKVRKKVTGTTLSFGDEEEASKRLGSRECLESEATFKVKKSSASRRLAHSKGQEGSGSTQQPTITSRATVGNAVSYSKEALEELKKSTLSTAPSSKSSGVGESLVEEKFPIQLGGSTIIPDANAIHLAKKKREQMRLRNDKEEEEFISLAGGDDDTVRISDEDVRTLEYANTYWVLITNLTSGVFHIFFKQVVEQRDTRLIREEDDELDDGEADLEKIMGDKLALGSKAQRLAELKKRAARKEMLEDMDEDDEDLEETREWELQQIRSAGVVPKAPKEKRSVVVHKSVAFPMVTQVPSIAEVRKRLQGHLGNLQQQHAMHAAQLSQIRHEEASISLRAVEAEEDIAKASARYTFFQELRSYCRNLAAFFEEKYPELESIEQDYVSLLSDRTKVVIERRRLDTKDDLAEFANVVEDHESKGAHRKAEPQELDEFGRSVAVDPMAVRRRRRADRARRQTQRKQARDVAAKEDEDKDGLSTDDELGAGDQAELGSALMDLDERRTNIFKEVGAEFKSLEAVKRHFQAWKTEYPRDYNKADSESDQDEEEEDMDKDLMSKVVAKSLCPKITRFLNAEGVDLYSSKQTRCLKAILDQLLDYVDKKDNKMDQLLKATTQTILETARVHRDQFVEAAQPLTPRHILTTEGEQARERYLWRTIGLFKNLMMLRRFVVPANSVDTLVVDGLLHDCILRLLEGDDKDTVTKYQMIYQALPHDIRSQERYIIINRMAQSL